MMRTAKSVMENRYLYNAYKYPWFSPTYILNCYDVLVKKFGVNVNESVFKRANELKSTAILLLGLYAAQGDVYYLQSYKEGDSPDVISMKRKEIPGKPIRGEFQEVEVVTYDIHSSETDIAEFLIKTKLKREKSYDAKTIILCYVNRDNTVIDFQGIFNKISETKPKPNIFILGTIKATNKMNYAFFQVWPELSCEFQFDFREIAKNLSSKVDKNIMHFKFSAAQKIVDQKEDFPKPTVFEVLDLDKSVVIAKYKDNAFEISEIV